ncbi:MAG TPA: class I SAM-dependent methyltransferase [Candidatus Eisenbacteria bacterium]|nr:class I SAM-dependent methyltransferase [Candidatus Eisenbacteria bacterium]
MGTGEAWRDATVAASFAAERAARVPESRTQIELLLRIVRGRLRGTTRVVDLACGDAVLLAALLDALPEASGTALDYSPAMLDLARDRLSRFGDRARVAAIDLRTPDWRAAAPGPVDVVVSGFAIHHLPDERKRGVYHEIFELLAKGGTFLNLEHVASATPAVEALHDDAIVAHHVAAARAAGKDVDPVAQREAYDARPDKADNILAPVWTQCEWLRAIGFVDVDVFWKWFELALFGGTKPCS